MLAAGDRRGRDDRRGDARRRSPGCSTPSSAACSSGASLLARVGVVVGGAAAVLDPERRRGPGPPRSGTGSPPARPEPVAGARARCLRSRSESLVALEPIAALAIVAVAAGGVALLLRCRRAARDAPSAGDRGTPRPRAAAGATLLRAGLGAAAAIAAAVIAVLVFSSTSAGIPAIASRRRRRAATARASSATCGSTRSSSAAPTTRSRPPTARLVHHEPAPDDPAPARRRHSAAPDRPALGGRPDRGRQHGLRGRGPGPQPGRQGAAAGDARGGGAPRRQDRAAARAAASADVWLCHTVCELGATRMSDALGEHRDASSTATRVRSWSCSSSPTSPGGHRARVQARGALRPNLPCSTAAAAADPRASSCARTSGWWCSPSGTPTARIPWYLDGF